jgi:hypothetical protein
MALRITTGTADTGSFRVGAFGAAVVVRAHGSGSAALERRLRHAWSRCAVSASPPVAFGETRLDVCVDGDPDVRVAARQAGMLVADDVPAAMDQLSSAITVAVVTQRAGTLLMLHACGLADPDTGATVALVAPSGTGKTTLARTLGTRWGYVSDETVAIDDDGGVLPYPKPLSWLTEHATVKDQLAPDDWGLLHPPADLRIAAVVLLDRQPDGPGTPHVDLVPTVPALAALAPETSYFTQQPSPLQRLATVLTRTGGLRRVTYAEATDLGGTVADLVRGQTR